MMVVNIITLVIMAISALSVCYENNREKNFTSNKLKMAYLIPWTGKFPAGQTMGPVVIKALDNVKNRGLLSNYDIELHWRDTQCDELVGVKMLIDIWRDNQDLDVIIGDVCSTVCYPASLLASAWNIPIISWGCMLEAVSEKSTHPTFSRVLRPASDRVGILKELVINFGWKRVGIISDNYIVYKEQSKKLFSKLRQINVTVFYYSMISFEKSRDAEDAQNNLKEIMKSIKNEVRVLIIYTFSPGLEKVSNISKEENMEKGYVFIVATETIYDPKIARAYQNWLMFTLFMPTLNEEALASDFDDPIFGGIIKSSSNQDKGKFSSYAGK